MNEDGIGKMVMIADIRERIADIEQLVLELSEDKDREKLRYYGVGKNELCLDIMMIERDMVLSEEIGY